MISSKTVAAASMRLTCSEGSSMATAIVLAKTAAVSTANISVLNVIAIHPSARSRAIRSHHGLSS